MKPKWSQLGTNMEQNGAKMGQHFEKNRFKKATQQKKGRNPTGLLHFGRKSGQHGPKLGSKIDQKSINNRCKNQSFFECLLGSIFERILVDFGRPRWLQNRSKIDKNAVSQPFCFRIALKTDFELIFAPNFGPLDLKKLYFS